MAKVLVLHDSAYGHVESIADAGADGARQPTQGELDGARYQGRRVAETAIKLHG